MESIKDDWKDDAKLTVEWFIEVMGREDWHRRRKNVVDYFKSVQEMMLNNGIEQSTENSKTILPIAFYDDWMAWYMYLVESLSERPGCDDPMQSNRIFPFFATIGRNIEALKKVPEIEERIKNVLNERQNQPDSTLFELAVAILYIRNGWEVEFLAARSDGKTPDLRVKKGDKNYFVECKRLAKANGYAEQERAEWQNKFQPLSSVMQHMGLPVHVNVVFKVPIDELPHDLLAKLFIMYVKSGFLKDERTLSTPQIDFKAKLFDLNSINEKLTANPTKPNSPKMLEVLLGKYDMHGNYGMFVAPNEVNFLHADDELAVLNFYYVSIHTAYLASWECVAEKSIDLRAKDLKKTLFRAINQFPDNESGIVHFGYETVNGPLVEIRREQKIKEVVESFDFKSKKIDAIYCNAMQFLAQATGYEWAETTIYFENDSKILDDKLLIDTPTTAKSDHTHWIEDAAKR